MTVYLTRKRRSRVTVTRLLAFRLRLDYVRLGLAGNVRAGIRNKRTKTRSTPASFFPLAGGSLPERGKQSI